MHVVMTVECCIRQTGNEILEHSVSVAKERGKHNYVPTDLKQCIKCDNMIRLQGFNTAVGFVVVWLLIM
jgi:hypothetical protein